MQTDIRTEDLPGIEDAFADAPRRLDRAVRAALSTRPPEPRSFGNEDDVEGPKVGETPRPS